MISDDSRALTGLPAAMPEVFPDPRGPTRLRRPSKAFLSSTLRWLWIGIAVLVLLLLAAYLLIPT